MYKVGDEVFIKAEITDVHRECDKPYFVHPNLDSLNWVSEEKIFPADKTYEQGLADAWELARRLYALRPDERDEMFKYCTVKAIIEDCTIEEVMDCIEAYENEKEIKVGDVVHHIGGKTFIVTYIHDDGHVSGITEEGGIYSRVGTESVVKSDKHIDIEGLLKQIGV